MITQHLITTFVVVSTIATWHALWYNSSLPASVFLILRDLGWHSGPDAINFWGREDDDPNTPFCTRGEWSEWWSTTAALYYQGFKWNLAYVVACPWCGGFHASWLGGIAAALVLWGARCDLWAIHIVAGFTVYPIWVYILSRRTL